MTATLPTEELLEEARTRVSGPLQPRELRGEIAAGAPFLAVAVAMFALGRPEVDPVLALSLVAAYALASHIRFEVGAGYTVPTQLALVPMLLLLPPAAVPLLVLAGNIISELPDYARGRRHPQRALVAFGNSWHAVGPALVLIAAGDPSLAMAHWPLYLAALLAQFAFDLGATMARE